MNIDYQIGAQLYSNGEGNLEDAGFRVRIYYDFS